MKQRTVHDWHPKSIGPRFDWLAHDRIRVKDGQLAAREFVVETRLEKRHAFLYLSEGDKRVGQASIERDPPGQGVVLWDIGVRPDLRRKGLASIMTWIIFRELIEHQQTVSFRIRMITSVKAGDKDVETQNLGICVVANRLGFTPEWDLEKLLVKENVDRIELMPPKDRSPAGFKILVRTYPLVLIAFLLDRDTQRPVSDYGTYLRLSKDERSVQQWVKKGLLVVSNGNYVLREGGFGRFLDAVAIDTGEAYTFGQRLREP
jgi:GNAT superfamily N-acetyltransferase